MSISDLDDSDLEFASADEGTSLSSESDNEAVTAKKAAKNDNKVEANKSDNNDPKKNNDESQKLEISDQNKQDESGSNLEKVADKTSDLKIDNILHELKQETKEPSDETTVKDELENKKVETKVESVDLKNDELKNTPTAVAAAISTNESFPVSQNIIEQDVKKLDEKLSNVKLEENKNKSKPKATTAEQAKPTSSSKTLKKLEEFSDLSESDDENDKNKHKKAQHSDSNDSGSEAEDTTRKTKNVNEVKKSDNFVKSPETVESVESTLGKSKVEKDVIDVQLEKTQNIEETNKETPKHSIEVDQPLEVKKEKSIKTEDIIFCETKKEENIVSNAGSGWNDTEFSDIDDNDEENEEKTDYGKDLTTVKTSTIDKRSAYSNNNKEDNSFWKENLTDENVKKQEPTQSQTKFQQPQQQQQQDSQQNSWSWSKFGTSLFSTATTLTTQLADGLNSVIGAPDPLELALKNKKEKQEFEESEEKNENKDDNNDKETKDSKEWADSFTDNSSDWFSAIPINKITNTLVTGSLDVLETVGKKTIEIINDKDPNFKQTKELIKKAAVPAKPNLSQLLREAQLESEKQSTNTNTSSNQSSSSSSYTYARKIEPNPNKQQTFSSYFEDFKGSSYLEALEMLSRQYNVKFEMLNINERKLNQLKPLNVIFNLDDLLNEDEDVDSEEFDFENFEDLIIDYMSEVGVKVQATVDRVIQSFKTASETSKQTLTVNELFNESVKCFALTTSTLIELYHKVAETLLIQQQNDKNSLTMVINKAEHLCQITKLCTRSTTMIANDFCRRIKSTQDKATSSSHTIANIYLEASNSNTYIGDSFILLAPIFKCLTLEEMEK